MDNDSDSELSSMSSALSEIDEAMEAKIEAEAKAARGLNRYFKPAPKDKKKKDDSPEPPKRAPSPPHEYVLADKDAIAFLVMFRSRFSDVFAKSLPHYGPQDIERGVSGDLPDENVERLLCALLDLCLNRKKPVERAHYGRALEDAISEFKAQWPKEWKGANPVSGSKSFNTMSAEERLTLFKTLVLWALASSEAVNTAIKQAYKQTRRDDDRNQPKAVQPWFSDRWRRKYYLIEGQEDTHFRIYRENDAKTTDRNVWFSVAGTIEEAKSLADKFETEMPGNPGKILADKVRMAVPRWEAGEEKRRRKDYRAARKVAFTRPEPGFSLYEGRTRGKRLRYTYDDNDDFDEESDATSGRRGRRDASDSSNPLEEGRPVVTSSGRTVKSRLGGMYGETMLMDQRKEAERERAGGSEDTAADEVVVGTNGRPVRSSIPTKRAAAARGRYADGLESGSETDRAAEPSGDEWSGNEDEPDDESEPDFQDGQESDDDIMDSPEEEENTQQSLVVQLRYRKTPSVVNGLNGTRNMKSTNCTTTLIGRSPLAQVQNADNVNGTSITVLNETVVDQKGAPYATNGMAKTRIPETGATIQNGEVKNSLAIEAPSAPAVQAMDMS